MTKSNSVRPHLVVADAQGNIYDDPELLMVCGIADQWALPRPDELIVLPPESEFFLLPKRHAVGYNEDTGEIEVLEDLAVAAFVAPAYTITAHPAYFKEDDAPLLPLFAYGALGFANGKFYVCAKKVDSDNRQVFKDVNKGKLKKCVTDLIAAYPDNRLIQHIMYNCVLRYDCPAARNLALGRFEAPIPVSRSCNARCVACISQQENDSGIQSTPQCRLDFTPSAAEIVELMLYHSKREKSCPIYSFGQGCEGEPLTEAKIISEAIAMFRAEGGRGTINCNSNASKTDAVIALAEAGLTSLRVSMNSARPDLYTVYYRPQNYSFDDVKNSMLEARLRGIYISINLLYFPGVTDTEEEIYALSELIGTTGVSFIQLRNLNIDPQMYLDLLKPLNTGTALGFSNFKKRLRKNCPWLEFGYFNPYLGDKAVLTAPMPGEWIRPIY